MSAETRRAQAAYALHDAAGGVTQQGTGDAVIGNDGVTVGPVTIAFLDADHLQAGDYRIEIGLWPAGSMVLTQLGRRFETFTAELRRARNQARVAGLLAHGVTMPVVFPAAVRGGPAECQVYDTHVTVVPEGRDPWQVPFGVLTGVERSDDPHAVALVTGEGRHVIGQLARRRDEFHRVVSERRGAQARVLQALTGVADFADGRAVGRPRLPRFDAMLHQWTAPDRVDCAGTLLRAARGDEPRFGLVQLLDPDADAMRSPAPLPEPWASFLLVPAGSLTVLEVLAGPSAATYVFAGTIEEVNRDLQLLHFRRGPLALTGTDAEPAPGNPYRLALRRLAPLQRLRAATRARLVHNSGWAAELEVALASQAGAGGAGPVPGPASPS